jgi:hypothetical protein
MPEGCQKGIGIAREFGLTLNGAKSLLIRMKIPSLIVSNPTHHGVIGTISSASIDVVLRPHAVRLGDSGEKESSGGRKSAAAGGSRMSEQTTNCPFYGRYLFRPRREGFPEIPFLLVVQSGNQCALVCGSHSPCLNTDREEIDRRTCSRVKDVRI